MIRRGFTLIELTVVVMVIGLFAAMVMPNIASSKASREYREFFPKVDQLVVEARVMAIESKQTVDLRFDDAEKEFFLERTDEEDNISEVGRRVSLPEDVSVEEVRQASQTLATGEWKISFYPDGSSDGGGIQINDNGQSKAFVISKLGYMTREDGSLPDQTAERWPAGDYERRG